MFVCLYVFMLITIIGRRCTYHQFKDGPLSCSSVLPSLVDGCCYSVPTAVDLVGLSMPIHFIFLLAYSGGAVGPVSVLLECSSSSHCLLLFLHTTVELVGPSLTLPVLSLSLSPQRWSWWARRCAAR